MFILDLPIEMIEDIIGDNMIIKNNLILSSKSLNNLKIEINYYNKFKFFCNKNNYNPSLKENKLWKTIDSYHNINIIWDNYIPRYKYNIEFPKLLTIKLTFYKELSLIKITSTVDKIWFWLHSIIELQPRCH